VSLKKVSWRLLLVVSRNVVLRPTYDKLHSRLSLDLLSLRHAELLTLAFSGCTNFNPKHLQWDVLSPVSQVSISTYQHSHPGLPNVTVPLPIAPSPKPDFQQLHIKPLVITYDILSTNCDARKDLVCESLSQWPFATLLQIAMLLATLLQERRRGLFHPADISSLQLISQMYTSR
jgi:hypothetical protein